MNRENALAMTEGGWGEERKVEKKKVAHSRLFIYLSMYDNPEISIQAVSMFPSLSFPEKKKTDL